MGHRLGWVLVCATLAFAPWTQTLAADEGAATAAIELDITTFGGRPDSGTDVVPAIKAAVAKAKTFQGKPVTIRFPKGRYDFWAKEAGKVRCPISGVHQQWDIIPGIALQGMSRVTIDGGGSAFLFHSRMTPFLILDSESVKICNFSTDFARPSVSEMTVEKIEGNTMEVAIHPDSKYTIKDGRLWWVGPDNEVEAGTRDMQFGKGHVANGFINPYRSDVGDWYDPVTDSIVRGSSPFSETLAEEIAPNKVRLHYAKPPLARPGMVFWARCGLRKQHNIVIRSSKDVVVQDLQVNVWDTFLVNGTLSENLTFLRIKAEPAAGSGHTCAGFADGIHLANCTGMVRIEDCRIVGLMDDTINVYGNQLIVTKREGNQVDLRYIQWEQCGYNMLFPGDEVDFFQRKSLKPLGSRRKVVSSELIDRMTMRVVLDGEVPKECLNQAAENHTRMPEIVIRGNTLSRTRARGILVSSWRKTLIESNTISKVSLQGILCNTGDSYGQQGAVKDLTIRGNTMSAGIFLKPEQPEASVEVPIQEGVTISGNTFRGLTEPTVLWARSSKGIRFTDNVIETSQEPVIWLAASSQVVIKDNHLSFNRAKLTLVQGTAAESVSADTPWRAP